MPFVPSLLSHVLPRMSHEVDTVRKAAVKVNGSLMDYIMSLSDESRKPDGGAGGQIQLPPSLSELGKELTGTQRRDSNLSGRLLKAVIRDQASRADSTGTRSPTPAEDRTPSPRPILELDYQAAVSALTLQFLNEHEATRVAAIAWLIMLHRMAPGRVSNVHILQQITADLKRSLPSMMAPFPRCSRRSRIPQMLSSHATFSCYHKYPYTVMIRTSLPLWLIS
jgi:vacuole morphology and inheritance protein 14